MFANEVNNGSYQITPDQALQNIKYYLIEGTAAYTSTMKNGTMFKSLQGAPITVTLLGNDIYLNDAKIVGADFLLSNGVIQVLNRWVYPHLYDVPG